MGTEEAVKRPRDVEEAPHVDGGDHDEARLEELAEEVRLSAAVSSVVCRR